MPDPLELYVAAPTRSVALVHRFLDTILPAREPAAVDYPVPEYSDAPTHTFRTVEPLLDHLESAATEPYGVYWRSAGDSVATIAMAFFTTDGGMILGVVLPASESTDAWFERLRDLVGATCGYLTCEERPPDTITEFARRAVQIQWDPA